LLPLTALPPALLVRCAKQEAYPWVAATSVGVTG
jgi:hypothetical protein